MNLNSIGIICEFNPLHNGHIYFINEVKRMYPGHTTILVLNGYFLQRGEVSVLSKEDKTFFALKNGVDVVLELPVLFGTQSADTFAEKSIELLNSVGVSKIIFGSECNDIKQIESFAKYQLNNSNYNSLVRTYLKEGINYPTAMAKALNTKFTFNPNDLLGISYIKAILKNKYDIKYDTLKRTNGFHDTKIDTEIVSASNIREKRNNGYDIEKYMPKEITDCLVDIDKVIYFYILKAKILTDNNLALYLDVDEGIEYRLLDKIKKVNNIEDYIKSIKTKRFTYNKINRMFTHILLGITKEDTKLDLSYTKIIGLNKLGMNYIKSIKKDSILPLLYDKDSEVYKYEQRASYLYEIITKKEVTSFESSNKPVISE